MVDKRKLPSRHVSVGPTSAPHRSYYYAMGMTEEQINQPFVGVVTTWNEAAQYLGNKKGLLLAA